MNIVFSRRKIPDIIRKADFHATDFKLIICNCRQTACILNNCSDFRGIIDFVKKPFIINIQSVFFVLSDINRGTLYCRIVLYVITTGSVSSR